ncbi:hypothetical protein ACFLV0_00805 [Chloroflexota bacterium]
MELTGKEKPDYLPLRARRMQASVKDFIKARDKEYDLKGDSS